VASGLALMGEEHIRGLSSTEMLVGGKKLFREEKRSSLTKSEEVGGKFSGKLLKRERRERLLFSRASR